MSTGDYKVADISLDDYGRKEIEMSGIEMPGLMPSRVKFGPARPLKDARISGSLHMTVHTAVLIETLKALGADLRWCSCIIYAPRIMPPLPLIVMRVALFSPGKERVWKSTGNVL